MIPPVSNVTSASDDNETALTNYSLSGVTSSLSEYQNTNSRLSQYPDSSLFSPDKIVASGSAVAVRSRTVAAAYSQDPRPDLNFAQSLKKPEHDVDAIVATKPPIVPNSTNNNNTVQLQPEVLPAKPATVTSLHASTSSTKRESTFEHSVKFAHALHAQTLADSTFRSNCAPLTSSTPERDASALTVSDLKASKKQSHASSIESDSVSRFVLGAGVSNYVTAAEREALIEQLLREAANAPADVSVHQTRNADVADEFSALTADPRPSFTEFKMATGDAGASASIESASLPGGGKQACAFIKSTAVQVFKLCM